jgi:hypothetical protein
MQRTDLTFTDGLDLDLFSATQYNLTVTQNFRPSAPGAFVTAKDPSIASLGSGFWTAVLNYSYVFKFEKTEVHGT